MRLIDQIKDLREELRWSRRLNTYHEIVFDAKKKAGDRFMTAAMLILVIPSLFLSIFFVPLAYFNFGVLSALLIYLIADRIFISKWRRAIRILQRQVRGDGKDQTNSKR